LRGRRSFRGLFVCSNHRTAFAASLPRCDERRKLPAVMPRQGNP
jgi:hypothetical protein